MATITLRAAKGSPLTNTEVDANFTNINNELAGKANTSSLATVATSGSYSDLTGRPTNVSSFTNDAGYVTASTVSAGYQPLDADLTAIAGLAGTSGFLKKTAANTWALDTNTYITSSDSITGKARLSEVQDTRAAQQSPQAYTSQSVTYEFSNQLTGMSGFYGGLSVKGWTGTSYVTWQLMGPADTTASENWYLRSGVGTTWNTSRLIMHAGNIGSYAPSLTGSGASGTWGINITGSAASITGTYSGSLTSSQVTTALGYTPANKAGDTFTGARPITISTSTGSVQIKGDAAGWSTGTLFYGSSGTYRGGFGALGSSDALSYYWIGPDYNNNYLELSSTYVNSKVALQQSGNQVLHAGNYTSYSPSLAGSGASGTWGISITGNAATVSSITSGQVTGALGYTPVKQGGGTGQGTNAVYIGWLGSQLGLQVDVTNFGATWPIGISGNAATATSASSASTATTASTANALNSANYYTGKGFDGVTAGTDPSITALTPNNGTTGGIRLRSNATTGTAIMQVTNSGITAQWGYMSFTSAGGLTWSGDITAFSDERLKKNWRTVTDNFVERLAGVKSGVFERTDMEITQVGVSAQSLREVMPEAVLDMDGTLSVNYGNAALASAVEIAKELVALKAEVVALRAELAAVKG